MPPVDNSEQGERRRFLGAAKTVAALTMLSRVLGLLRDMLIVPLGGGILADRFWTAFSVPNLFRRLFGEGALSAAFVPVFTTVAEAEGWQKARLVLANVAGVLTVALAALIVLVELGLWAAWAVLGGDWARMVLLQLTALMLPFMFTVCLLALGSAALNCKGHFAYPAAAPIILNVGLIISACWAAPALARDDARGQFFVIAGGLLVTGVVQLLGVVWLLHRSGLAVVPRLAPLLPEVKHIAKLMAPMLLPLSVLQFSAFADRLIALIFTGPGLPLTDGTVRCIYAANRLYQLPMGVLGISIATVVFPLFSRYAARNDVAGLRDATNRALRLGAFLGIPAGVALILLARPVVALIFERRSFQEADTERAALILTMYCLGMSAYFWNHILLRAFYAMKETRAPLILASILSGVNLLLVLGGIFTPLKAGAIGLATACTSSANALLLLWALRRRWGRLGFRTILASITRTAVATTCMGGAIALARWQLTPIVLHFVRGRMATGIVVAACVVAGITVFFVAAAVLRCPELRDLLSRGRKTPATTEPPNAGAGDEGSG